MEFISTVSIGELFEQECFANLGNLERAGVEVSIGELFEQECFMSTTTELRETDTKARITLPKGFANSTVLIEVVSDVELVIRKAKVVPLQPGGDVRFLEEDPITLTVEDRLSFIAALDNPPPANEALKKLMSKRKK